MPCRTLRQPQLLETCRSSDPSCIDNCNCMHNNAIATDETARKKSITVWYARSRGSFFLDLNPAPVMPPPCQGTALAAQCSYLVVKLPQATQIELKFGQSFQISVLPVHYLEGLAEIIQNSSVPKRRLLVRLFHMETLFERTWYGGDFGSLLA